jgi:5-methylcytosine-specific restriction protein B
VFIIDEINRGNLSKILGELMLLIEHDKRGEKHGVPLTYSAAKFSVPENLYLMGLMNTADRSLAMVDYALRRRFVFFDIEPEFESADFAQHLLDAEADEAMVARIRNRLGALNATISSNPHLGKGFRVGHSFFCLGGGEEPNDAWYLEIIEHEIADLEHQSGGPYREQASKPIDGAPP